MRHAQAEQGLRMDANRKLTDKGKKEAKNMAAFIKRQGYSIDSAISSDFKRAVDTVSPIAKDLEIDYDKSEKLRPDGNVKDAMDEISQLCRKSSSKGVLVVTHHPLVSSIVSNLIGSKEGANFKFAHASIAHVIVTKNNSELHSIITPKIVEREADDESKEAIIALADKMSCRR